MHRIEVSALMRIIGGGKGAHCLYPLQIDPTYKGCTHGCLYCYAASLSNSFGLSFDTLTSTDTELLRKRLMRPTGRMGDFIKRKHPIRIGGMSDPFMRGINAEKTIEVLDILNEFEYPYIILTKSHSIADAIDHLNPELAQIQISAANRNYDIIEPNASCVPERLSACKTLADAGFDVIGRMAPIIPLYADGAEWSRDNEICNGVDFSLPRKFEICGARGLILEMIRLTPWMINNLENAGVNIRATITDKSIRKNGTIFYSLETRQRYYDALSYTALPVTYCDIDLWSPSTMGDCCQFAVANGD
jgi:DNA repair photolyase